MIRYIQNNNYIHRKVYKFTAPAGLIKRMKKKQRKVIVVDGHFGKPQRALLVKTARVPRAKAEKLKSINWHEDMATL